MIMTDRPSSTPPFKTLTAPCHLQRAQQANNQPHRLRLIPSAHNLDGAAQRSRYPRATPEPEC
jgi:hypothetical protein